MIIPTTYEYFRRDLVEAVCARLNGQLDPDGCIMYEEYTDNRIRETFYSPLYKRSKLKQVDSISDNDDLIIHEVPLQLVEPVVDGNSSDEGVGTFGTYSSYYSKPRYKNYSDYHYGLDLGENFKGTLLIVSAVRKQMKYNYVSWSQISGTFLRLMHIEDEEKTTARDLHHRIWELVKSAVKALASPSSIYEAAASELMESGQAKDSAAGAADEIDNNEDSNVITAASTDTIDIDEKMETETTAAVTGSTTNTTGGVDAAPDTSEQLPYKVLLGNEHGNVLRIGGNAYDTTKPSVPLPYSDVSLAELKAKYNKKLRLMVVLADEGVDDKEIMPIKELADEVEADEDDDSTLKIEKCLMAFSKKEQLGSADTWYCSKCKDHVQAFKKMDVWTAPRVLTLHLKRFQYESGYMREKLDSLVKFNETLDMAPFVAGPQPDSELKYQLVAVSNHIGFGIGGGHYTAYARHNDKWHLFNDSTVSPARPDSLCTDEAYVLFYRRIEETMMDKSRADGDYADDGSAGGYM